MHVQPLLCTETAGTTGSHPRVKWCHVCLVQPAQPLSCIMHKPSTTLYWQSHLSLNLQPSVCAHSAPHACSTAASRAASDAILCSVLKTPAALSVACCAIITRRLCRANRRMMSSCSSCPMSCRAAMPCCCCAGCRCRPSCSSFSSSCKNLEAAAICSSRLVTPP